MSKRKKKKQNSIFPGIVFAFIGIVFFIVGIAIYFPFKANMKRLKEEGAYTECVISKIESYGYDDDITYDVYADFTPEGTESITVKLNTYSSSMYIGKTIGIYYNTENPYDFMEEGGAGNVIVLLLFCGIGLLFFIVGLIVFVKT